MTTTLFLVIVVIVTALFFDFTNGFHDSANAMATSVATGALRPRTAVLVAAVLNVVGRVPVDRGRQDDLRRNGQRRIGHPDDDLRRTGGGDPVEPDDLAVRAAIQFVARTVRWSDRRCPGRRRGGRGELLGGGVQDPAAGDHGAAWSPAWPPAWPSSCSTGWFHDADQEPAAGWFRRAQTVSGSMIALAHGTSDGQKTMGVITLVLITAGYQDSGTGPQTWVIAAAGLAIGLGTYSGGWRIMRTMGKGLVDLHSPQGFAAETTSAAAILASAHMGFGLSTTQVCSGSVIGSGAGRRLSLVRWGTARRMVYGWLLTLPAAALFGAVAAAVALTGPVGVVIVLVALIAGHQRDRRHLPPNRGEPAQRQRVQRCHGPVQPDPHRARVAVGSTSAAIPPGIAPIVIRQPDRARTDQRHRDEGPATMTINWGALILVAVATVTAAVSIVGLFSLGVAALTARQRAGGTDGTSSVMASIAGYSCLAVSGAIAAYGLYLIIPQFH